MGKIGKSLKKECQTEVEIKSKTDFLEELRSSMSRKRDHNTILFNDLLFL